MSQDLASRLRTANATLEKSDPKLAEELKTLRGDAGGDARHEIENALRSSRGSNGLAFESLGGAADVAELALETIVLRTGRPVLTIFNDEPVLSFRDAESEIWRSRLTSARDVIRAGTRSVGRIEVQNHSLDWIGTGWLVAPDVVVTNRHVASEFAARRGQGLVFKQGFGSTMSATIDFLEELGNEDSREFALTSVLHIEPEPGPDVAFLRVDQRSGSELGTPIKLSARPAVIHEQVAVIGYPARDSRIPEQDLMLKIFGDVFDKKRLAPGQVMRMQGGLVLHDCSTLGGCSGGVVLGLDSGEALALHFSGRFLEANFAVPARVVMQRLQNLRRNETRSIAVASSRAAGDAAARKDRALSSAASIEVTVPIRIRVDVGQTTVGTETTPRTRAARVVAPARDGDPEYEAEDHEIVEEGRAEDYTDREGYVSEYLGEPVPLPAIDDDGDVLTFLEDGKWSRELKYQHFSVVMSKRRRLCYFSAVNINGELSRKVKRTNFRTDPRIAKEHQITKGVYGNAPKYSRGHMTRREDPVWGDPDAARRGNSDSMHLTNVVPQMQAFNAGIWLGLEDYALDNARGDDMKISVLTGPVFSTDDPFMFGVQIPRSFWKVIAFIHDDTGELCATGYTMSQESFLREEEFVFGQHETAQVPLSVIESLAGISFSPDLVRLDPLGRVAEARPRMLRDFNEIRFR